MANFTPQQIEEFLQEFFNVVGTRQYIGARYVPLFGRKGEDSIEWDGGAAPYEPLTIVTWQGDSYTSRQYVPRGISIGDGDYWARTGNFNGQIEAYREEVARYAAEVEGMLDESKAYTDAKADDLEYSKVPFPITDRLGTEGQVLSTNADGTTAWANPVIPDAEATAAAVDAWLDEHPEATTTVEDNSITNAKIRDNTIKDEKLSSESVKRRVDTVVGTVADGLFVENATSSGNDSYTPNVSNRLLSGYVRFDTVPATIACNTGYNLRAFSYDVGLNFVSSIQWTDSFTANLSTRFYRFLFRKNDGTDITPDDIEDILTAMPTNITCLIPSVSLYEMTSKTNGDLDTLQASTETNAQDIASVSNRLDVVTMQNGAPLYVEQASIDSAGVYTHGVSSRLLTGYIKPTSAPVAITPSTGYKVRLVAYDTAINHMNVLPWTDQATAISRTDRYVRVIVGRSNDGAITPDDFDNAVTIAGDFKCLIPSASILGEISDTRDVIATNQQSFEDWRAERELQEQFGMNMNLMGNYDEVWEYNNWMYPMAQSLDALRDRLFFAFTTHSGHAGISQYDFESGLLTKNIVKRNVDGEHDDHNIMGIRVLSNHLVACAYSGGHNADKRIYVRYGLTQESVDIMSEVVALDSDYLTSYAQLFEYGSKLWLFYRAANTRWMYRYSDGIGAEGLKTWSEEHELIAHSAQMYITLRETTTPGTLRLCCYSNPSADDTSIRMCFFHLGNRTLYDVDDTTPLGMSTRLQDVTAIIPVPSGGKVNRLLEAAITPVADTKVIYCTFTNSAGSDDGEYYVYDNGTVLLIAACGEAIWIPKAQNGACWCGTDKIVVGRGDQGRDLIEIYDYDVSTGAILNKTIASNLRNQRGTEWYRTARPIVDDNQRVVIFWEGYYNPNVFTNSRPSARIYDIDNDEMLV